MTTPTVFNEVHAQTARAISLILLPPKLYPPQEETRSRQQDTLLSRYVVELGHSTHPPRPERMRPKTRLPPPKSEQPQRKRAAKKQSA